MEFVSFRSRFTGIAFSAAVAMAVFSSMATVDAGIGGGFNRAVGGVLIDANGVVRAATINEQKELANMVRVALQQPAGDLSKASELRMISLKGLQQQVRESRETGRPLKSEVEFLAGLQRVEYVFVNESENDIIIAGPAEPWTLRADGSVVGTQSGKSTMRLADLIVALRSVETARNGGISCSIEPTEQGRKRLQTMLRRMRLSPGQSPAVFEASMKEAFGPQMIRLTGVQRDTRYARSLVAADFEMKRIAMELVSSNVPGLPSYLDMSRGARHNSSQNPRWWMACDYDALAKSEDSLAWKLSGQGVKTMTEQDIVEADGSVKSGGKVDKIAQNWADAMTKNYAELAQNFTVFGDLQNIMDMTVVATLIVQERLDQTANLDLSILMEQEKSVELTSYKPPTSVDPQCSFIRGRSGWIVTASGGVDIDGFGVVENQIVDNAVRETRETAIASAGETWWWDKR